jgi:hypothetical protein
MYACTETDVRESANDYILASGEGHGSREETFQPIYIASPVSSSVEHPILLFYWVHYAYITTGVSSYCIRYSNCSERKVWE